MTPAPVKAALASLHRRGRSRSKYRAEPTENFVLHCKARGMVLPVAEYRFAPPRRWRFDFAWTGEDVKLAVEVDGGGWNNGRHSRGLGMRNDCEKFAEAMIRGWRVLRVMPEHVRSGQAADWVQKIFNASEQW